MTPGSHARADQPERRPGRAPARRGAAGGSARRWSCCSAAALFVVSADNSEGTDLRPGRYTDLAALVADRGRPVRRARAAGSPSSTPRSTDAERRRSSDTDVKRCQRKVERLRGPGRPDAARPGPGVTVTLSDAPEDVINSTTSDLNLLVVHQQDIQAVVNAHVEGRRRRRSPIQGQRVVTTTGIKCEGNSVQLQGVPYPQPYVIEAVGDQAATARRDRRRRLPRRSTASRPTDPDISVGWDLELEDAGHRAGVRRPARPAATPSRSADRGRLTGDAGRRRRRVGRSSVGSASSASAVGRSAVGGSVGSSNVETTIVTVVPCGGVLAGRAGSARSPCPSARSVSVDWTTSRLEAGVADRLLGLAPAVRPTTSGTFSGPSE